MTGRFGVSDQETPDADLPARFSGIILAFAPLFVHRSWLHAHPVDEAERTLQRIERLLVSLRARRSVMLAEQTAS